MPRPARSCAPRKPIAAAGLTCPLAMGLPRVRSTSLSTSRSCRRTKKNALEVSEFVVASRRAQSSPARVDLGAIVHPEVVDCAACSSQEDRSNPEEGEELHVGKAGLRR